MGMEIHLNLLILTCDPLIYLMNHLNFIILIVMGEAISIKYYPLKRQSQHSRLLLLPAEMF